MRKYVLAVFACLALAAVTSLPQAALSGAPCDPNVRTC